MELSASVPRSFLVLITGHYTGDQGRFRGGGMGWVGRTYSLGFGGGGGGGFLQVYVLGLLLFRNSLLIDLPGTNSNLFGNVCIYNMQVYNNISFYKLLFILMYSIFYKT